MTCVGLWNSHPTRHREVNTQQNVRETVTGLSCRGCGCRHTQVRQVSNDDLRNDFDNPTVNHRSAECTQCVKMCLKVSSLKTCVWEWVSVCRLRGRHGRDAATEPSNVDGQAVITAPLAFWVFGAQKLDVKLRIRRADAQLCSSLFYAASTWDRLALRWQRKLHALRMKVFSRTLGRFRGSECDGFVKTAMFPPSKFS